jgi:hypothetical protein
LRGHNAAGAGPIFNDELVSKPSREFVSEHAHRYVGYAAGGVGDDQADRPIGIIILRHGRARRCGQEYRGNGREEAYGSHNVSLFAALSDAGLAEGLGSAVPWRAGSGDENYGSWS